MKKTALICLIMVAFASAAAAGQAREIMEKVDNRNDGQTVIAHVSLTTFRYMTQNGKTRAMEQARIKRMTFVKKDEGPREKDHKSVSILREPKSEQGIGFLQYDYEEVGKETDQWMYLSALGKVKRIVAGNDNEPKTGSYFGSEFNYEDMEAYNLDDFTYTLLGPETYRDTDCWVIEAVPVLRKAKKSNYSRQILWIDKDRDMILKAVLFNRNGKKTKIIMSGNIETLDGILVPRKIVVDNVESRRRTVLLYETIVLNRPVDDEFLRVRTLTDKGYRERKLQEFKDLK
ncbi:MAG: outer membrane lipoprotein-sorting protein [Proteobacteria bacterium]|nr:outer membrane lipoprotein-sorting protein [Pseudomonadota bacterium]